MTTIHEYHRTTTLAVAALGLLCALGLPTASRATPPALGEAPPIAAEDEEACGATYDPGATYPGLPEADGADVSGKDGVRLYLHEDRAVADIAGCFYTVDRELLVDFADLDLVELIFELPDHPDGASIDVLEDGEWLETLTVTGPVFTHALGPAHTLGFGHKAPPATTPQASAYRAVFVRRSGGVRT